MKGKKHDQDKPMWHLLPFREVEQVVKVLTYGKHKYGQDDWKQFVSRQDNWKRYVSACLRHVSSFMEGHDKDQETGFSHLSHAICCLLFVLWRKNEDEL